MSDQVVSKASDRMPNNEGRVTRLSNRSNSDFKWTHDKSVIGAIEVPSAPFFNCRGSTTDKVVAGLEGEYEECKKLWNDLKLKRSFVKACDGIPPSTKFCGMVVDRDKTIKTTAAALNKGWAKCINKKLRKDGFKITCFTWVRSNAFGKPESVVFLIRFHSLSTRRFHEIQRTSRESGVVEGIFSAQTDLSVTDDERSTLYGSVRDSNESHSSFRAMTQEG